MKISILLGSIRSGRQSHKLAHYLDKQLQDRGVVTDLIDMIDNPLPVFQGNENKQPKIADTINDLAKRFESADGILIVTPEYHSGIPGSLKNTIDIFGGNMSKKPVAAAAASSGKHGGINAWSQLQTVILRFGGYPFPGRLFVSEIQNAFDDSYEPKEKWISQAAKVFLDELLWFTKAISDAKKD